jgi:hypothetical protein
MLETFIYKLTQNAYCLHYTGIQTISSSDSLLFALYNTCFLGKRRKNQRFPPTQSILQF